METLIPLFTFIIGAGISYFISRKLKPAANVLESREYKELKESTEALSNSFNQLKESNIKLETENINFKSRCNEYAQAHQKIKDENLTIRTELTASNEQKKAFETQRNNLEEQIAKVRERNIEITSENTELIKNQTSITEKKNATEKRLEESLALTNKLQDKFKNEIENAQKNLNMKFENLANQIFEEKTKKFKSDSSESINTLLQPFKTQLESFKTEFNSKYSKDKDERVELKTEIKQLMDLNKTITNETNNLTQALRGDVKKQGNWGEFKLELLLERSNLEKGKEYYIQGGGLGLKDHQGGTQLPDVIVNLPDNKKVVIDSKVSLNSYYSYIECEEKEEKDRHLNNLIKALQNHIDGLSAKQYELNTKLFTPEFVLMFFPLEGALSLVIDSLVPRHQISLMQYAWDRSIVIVTPTTLMATLRTIASIWKFEKQEQNAQKIAEEGGKLYDKFHSFMADMQNIEKSINKTQESYQSAYKKLYKGRGNVISKVESLRQLGSSTKKQLDEEITSLAIANDKEEEVA